MLQLSATRCSCITILWVNLVSFVAITLCVASQGYLSLSFISLSTQSGNFGHNLLYIFVDCRRPSVTITQWVGCCYLEDDAHLLDSHAPHCHLCDSFHCTDVCCLLEGHCVGKTRGSLIIVSLRSILLLSKSIFYIQPPA
jgi:hypothetical protein